MALFRSSENEVSEAPLVIFIDEAGVFSNPQQKRTYVSCIAGLAIPEGAIDRLYHGFRILKHTWGVASGEVKGSALNESHVAAVVRLVAAKDVVLKVVATDLGLFSDAEISAHKVNQAKKLKTSAGNGDGEVASTIRGLAEQTAALSNPLYVQSHLLTYLIDDLIQATTLYYSQRIPETLGSFEWVLDAKDKETTRYERLWTQLSRPHLQTLSLYKPLLQLTSADYSHFKKFCGVMKEPPKHLASEIGREEGEEFHFIEINELLRSVQFCNSRDHLGLQITDILVTSIRRALGGNLQQSGWGDIGRLMVQPSKGSRAVRLLSFGAGGTATVPYARIIEILESQSKPMLR